MTTPVDAPPPSPPDAARIANFILDHNPLYLLSAALMLLGCYQFSSAIDLQAGEVGKLLALLGALNAYEFLIIGLAIFLWKTRRLFRDSTLLLMIEGLFVADLTFLNSEVAANNLALGAVVNAVLFILALGKLHLVVWMLRLERSPRTLAFITLQLGLLAALPIVLRWISVNGLIEPQPFYQLWWLVGLLPVVYDLLARFFWIRPAARDSAIRITWTVLPWISLIAHLGFQHWVYRADFFIAEVAPILLALAVIAPRLPEWLVPRASATFVRAVLGVMALVLGSTNPTALLVDVPGTAASLSPAVLTLAATALAWTYCWRLSALPWTIGVLATLGTLRLYGPSLQQIGAVVDQIFLAVRNAIRAVTPTSSAGWGILAMISSFVTLALGALVSLTRPRREN